MAVNILFLFRYIEAIYSKLEWQVSPVYYVYTHVGCVDIIVHFEMWNVA